MPTKKELEGRLVVLQEERDESVRFASKAHAEVVRLQSALAASEDAAKHYRLALDASEERACRLLLAVRAHQGAGLELSNACADIERFAMGTDRIAEAVAKL